MLRNAICRKLPSSITRSLDHMVTGKEDEEEDVDSDSVVSIQGMLSDHE
jgi:hypothetical protein